MDLKPNSQHTGFIFQRLGWETDPRAPRVATVLPAPSDEAASVPIPTIEITLTTKAAKSESEK
ncbi:hypothetical protein SAMN05880582_102261 [Rhizobium sp. RU20A]|uniref:hypothetical protein n=1 Tax=Rhizobium sp. RU20A TaxID=1907412 RepID=UPI000954143E|nr:hypothetical protein [Rhizobium sp. RU20A]SIQ60242.1 hypothetical protein SAMN05880582_102261 [Rhizobium sp. RU20A]